MVKTGARSTTQQSTAMMNSFTRPEIIEQAHSLLMEGAQEMERATSDREASSGAFKIRWAGKMLVQAGGMDLVFKTYKSLDRHHRRIELEWFGLGDPGSSWQAETETLG